MASGLEAAVGVQALIVLFIVYRSIRVYYGRPLSPTRLFVFPGLAVILFLASEVETVASVPGAYPGWAIVDGIALVAAALATIPLAPRLVRLTKLPDGSYLYRYGIELIGLYLAFWIARFALALIYDPSSLAFNFSSPTSLSGGPATVMLIVQALFAISSGIVVGRSIGTYGLYQRELAPLPTAGQ